MREKLADGTRLVLSSGDNHNTFVISSFIGYGATCIVYNAYYLDEFRIKHWVKLKECFPLNGTNEDRFESSVVWKNEEEKAKAINDFIYTYKQHLALQANYNFVNTTCKISDVLYHGNNTRYIVMEADNGKVFNEAVPKTLHRILRVIYALTNTIEKYHEIGFLHLDIKPENFMVIPETEDLVKLFDFDSLVSMDDINAGVLDAISYTNKWAAPEVRQCKMKKIGPPADIYSIGTILFFAIFNKTMDVVDRNFFNKYDFEGKEILSKVDPSIKNELRDFFVKSLNPSIRKRYQNMDEVKEALSKMIIKADPNRMYLCSSMPPVYNYFCGREQELQDLHSMVSNHKVTVISGMGGLGKSELVKQFMYRHEEDFDHLVYITVKTSLNEALNKPGTISISNYNGESINDLLTALNSVVSKKTVIALDNIMDFSDPLLMDLLKIDAKFIITTRKKVEHFFDGMAVLCIDTLAEKELYETFTHYYTRYVDNNEQQRIIDIIKYVKGYTLIIPIMAKQMMASSRLPSKMLEILKEYGFKGNTKERVTHVKDEYLSERTMFDHIMAIFSTADLAQEEILVLRILSLVGEIDVDKTTLAGWCGLRNRKTDIFSNYFRISRIYEDVDLSFINTLIDNGWIIYNEKENYVSTHDVIREWTKEFLVPTYENTKPFWDAMEAICSGIKKNMESFIEYGEWDDVDFDLTEYAADMYIRIFCKSADRLIECDDGAFAYIIQQAKKIYGKNTQETLYTLDPIRKKAGFHNLHLEDIMDYYHILCECAFDRILYHLLKDGYWDQDYEKEKKPYIVEVLLEARNFAETCIDGNNKRNLFLFSLLSRVEYILNEYSYFDASHFFDNDNDICLAEYIRAIISYIEIHSPTKELLEKVEGFVELFDNNEQSYKKSLSKNDEADDDVSEDYHEEKSIYYKEYYAALLDERETNDEEAYWNTLRNLFSDTNLDIKEKIDLLDDSIMIIDDKIGRLEDYDKPSMIVLLSARLLYYFERSELFGKQQWPFYNGREELMKIMVKQALLLNREDLLWHYTEEYYPYVSIDYKYGFSGDMRIRMALHESEMYTKHGFPLYTIRFLDLVRRWILEEGSFPDLEYKYMPRLMDELCDLSKEVGDGYSYYYYKQYKAEKTGVHFSLEKDDIIFSEKKNDTSLVETYFDYIDSMSYGMKFQREQILAFVKKNTILTAELKDRIYKFYYYNSDLSTIRLIDRYNDFLEAIPNSDVINKNLEMLNKRELDTYQKIICVAELCYQYIINKDEVNVSSYVNQFMEIVKSMEAYGYHFVDLMIITLLPTVLWKTCNYKWAAIISKGIEINWIATCWDDISNTDFILSCKFIEDIYDIIQDENIREYLDAEYTEEAILRHEKYKKDKAVMQEVFNAALNLEE